MTQQALPPVPPKAPGVYWFVQLDKDALRTMLDDFGEDFSLRYYQSYQEAIRIAETVLEATGQIDTSREGEFQKYETRDDQHWAMLRDVDPMEFKRQMDRWHVMLVQHGMEGPKKPPKRKMVPSYGA